MSSASLPLRTSRPALHVETLVLLVAVFLLLALNGSFWRASLSGRDWHDVSTWSIAAAMFVAFSAFYFAFAASIATRHTVKPLLTVMLLVSAAASYYTDRYAIYFDRAMLRNVLATDYGEARELLGWSLGLHLLVFGAVPSLLVWWPRLKRRPWGKALVLRLAWVAAAVAVGVASLLPVLADFASLMRNHREVRHLMTPGNVVSALAGNAWGRAKRPPQARQPVGADARLGAGWQARSRPTLFVLVVGETARSQNFSLNGYGRDTNPELARRDVVSLSNVQACGTSTEVSLPCMFSSFGRRHYDEEKILGHESLLHVLARAGFQIHWLDNQSGCKGVCDGLPAQQADQAKVQALCVDGKCLDEVLLRGIEGVARDRHGNVFVVMHQMGSHGPAYYRRYPAAFRRFTPACESDDLRVCSKDQIVNAYDNSLLYTDHVLARLIDFLDRVQATHDTAMLYVSDHGESLGENGLYLHGMPYAIAPEAQTRVPLVMWMSRAFRRSFGIDQECMRGRAALTASHDNLFHSVLGVLDVETVAYEAGMDLFAPCQDRMRAAVNMH